MNAVINLGGFLQTHVSQHPKEDLLSCVQSDCAAPQGTYELHDATPPSRSHKISPHVSGSATEQVIYTVRQYGTCAADIANLI
jgi:hypothetical protein